MDNMVEIGVPVYKAKDTLPDLLDTMVAQTRKTFIVCLSIDADGEDYTNIIETYRTRGLKIRTIYAEENGGPGAACQRVLDTTQCDYIMFADADDLLMPRAVETLYRGIVSSGYDILRSSFIKESANEADVVLEAKSNVITWRHGKIYRTQYLRDIDLCFLPGLRTDEDAYFNIIAWNCTKQHGILNEITYIWRCNKNSITRNRDEVTYFKETYNNYIHGQVEALKKIFNTADEVANILVTKTLINIYFFYMRARFYKCDESIMDNTLKTLKNESWMKIWFATPQNWIDAIENLKVGQFYDKQYVIFYEENFYDWATRLLKGD